MSLVASKYFNPDDIDCRGQRARCRVDRIIYPLGLRRGGGVESLPNKCLRLSPTLPMREGVGVALARLNGRRRRIRNSTTGGALSSTATVCLRSGQLFNRAVSSCCPSGKSTFKGVNPIDA